MRSRRRDGAPGVEVQGLEQRRFLSADLTAVVDGYILPAGAVTGQQLSGTVTVVVKNSGDAAVGGGAGAKGMTVRVTALGDAGAPGGKNIKAGEKVVSVAGLKPGKTVRVVVPVVIPPTNGGGQFQIAATVDSKQKVEESDETNNTAAAKKLYKVKVPRATLKATAASVTIKKSGEKGTGAVTIVNAGDVSVTGKADVIFEAVPTEGSLATVQLGKKAGVATNLKPKQSVKVTGVVLKAVPATVDAADDVTYTIRARVVAKTSPKDVVAGDNADNIRQVTSEGAGGSVGTDPGPEQGNPLTAAGLGRLLKFSTGTTTPGFLGLGSTTTGTVRDSLGHSGTYVYKVTVAGLAGDLTINFPATATSQKFAIEVESSPYRGIGAYSPAGKTLIFTTSKDGAVAELDGDSPQPDYYFRLP